jgi:hypothetical protein
MPKSRFQRRIVWLVLAMYMAAGVTAELAHEHHVSDRHASNGLASNGHVSIGHATHSHDADHDAIASSVATSDDDLALGAASAPAASHDDDCAACRWLGQLSHGFAPPAPFECATRIVPLACPSATCILAGSRIAPHSRGPPQLV